MKQFEATWSETPRPGWSSEAAGVGVGCGVLGGWCGVTLETRLACFHYICFIIFVQPMSTSDFQWVVMNTDGVTATFLAC